MINFEIVAVVTLLSNTVKASALALSRQYVGLEMVHNRTNLNPSPSAVDSNPSTFNPSGSQGWSPKQ